MFTDRREAGRRLAGQLRHLRGPDTVVLGLPRGGVPVAYEVATGLGAPLDVILVRKLGLPTRPELAMGAVGEGGVAVFNHQVLQMAGVGHDQVAAVEARERAELARRSDLLREGRDKVPLAGRTALVVDDGLATGATARAACQVARAQGAERVVLAAPVGPEGCAERFAGVADEVVCVACPPGFSAISQFYRDFAPTSDAEVARLLDRAAARGPDPARAPAPSGTDQHVAVGDLRLPGRLRVPAGAGGVVVFAHGSGSSRLSVRNNHVADVLDRHGCGTLLLDLLTEVEAGHRANVFDIPLLADRLLAATRWLAGQSGTDGLRVAYFGASTGAAAALWAAAEPGADVASVVCRGGRPDLAEGRLPKVAAPTLLIVGGADLAVLDLNQRAQRELTCESSLVVVPGAGHLFEEPGTLDQVAQLAAEWFTARW